MFKLDKNESTNKSMLKGGHQLRRSILRGLLIVRGVLHQEIVFLIVFLRYMGILGVRYVAVVPTN